MNTLNPTTSKPAPSVEPLTPEEVRERFECGDVVVVDVREPFERLAVFIPGSHAAPLSSFDPQSLREAHPTACIVFHCKSGARSADAAKRFAQTTGAADVGSLAGGIDAWRIAGLPVERSAHAPKLDIMRQVQMIAGGLVLLGVLLGAFVHPAFLAIAAFVGGGLFFAGASGWCGMALLLGRMPWNRVPGEAPRAACSTDDSCCSN